MSSRFSFQKFNSVWKNMRDRWLCEFTYNYYEFFGQSVLYLGSFKGKPVYEYKLFFDDDFVGWGEYVSYTRLMKCVMVDGPLNGREFTVSFRPPIFPFS